MDKAASRSQGIKLLVQKCRNEFRRPENMDFYASDDFKEAEKKFIKYCLYGHQGT